MSHETFALNLCKANAELQLEFGRLLLENAQRNLELLQRGAAQGLADAGQGHSARLHASSGELDGVRGKPRRVEQRFRVAFAAIAEQAHDRAGFAACAHARGELQAGDEVGAG